MVPISFSLWLIVVFSLLLVILVFLWWRDLVRFKVEKIVKPGKKEVERCPYCSAIVEVTETDKVIRCPVCQSYFGPKCDDKEECK